MIFLILRVGQFGVAEKTITTATTPSIKTMALVPISQTESIGRIS
jgi:hypothetical protein